jgi:hypothetical protein
LPYLKLLEIHRRAGRRDAYDLVRGQFNARFNAHAPDWPVGLQTGRTLEDYPEVVARLQRAWPVAADAIAALQGMLLRNAGGQPFDLPAYRDLLFLYTLRRDAADRGTAGSGPAVDLLLPLDADEAPATLSFPPAGPRRVASSGPMPLEVRRAAAARPTGLREFPTRALRGS